MLNDASEIIVGTILVIGILIIIGAVASIPGSPSEAKVIAEKTSNSISLLWIFYLGLPSVGLFVAIIVWIKKKFDENKAYPV